MRGSGKTYAQKIAKLISDIDNLIIESLEKYDTLDLQNIIVGLVLNHTFTSGDSVQNLIYALENIKEEI